MDQGQLVDRAKRGDHEAFATLVAGAASRLLGASRLIVRDPDLAYDATQDALVRAWRDLPGLRDVERFDAWLHRLTVNACLDVLRRRRRRPIEVEIGELDRPAPGDEAASVVDRDALDRALSRLEPESRAVVVLHYYLGLAISEVASTLGIPDGTAKSRLHRALGAMRDSIEGGRTVSEPAREGQPA